jgi:hypothetical protein
MLLLFFAPMKTKSNTITPMMHAPMIQAFLNERFYRLLFDGRCFPVDELNILGNLLFQFCQLTVFYSIVIIPYHPLYHPKNPTEAEHCDNNGK